MLPTLNWRELSVWVDAIRPEVEEMFVDKVIIPERKSFPDGYLKGEWAIRLTARKNERVLIFSARPRRPYVVLCPDKGPKASALATHAAFDLALSKHLRGTKLKRIEALPRERTIVVWFDTPDATLGLALQLIPAKPDAILFREAPTPPFVVIARARASGNADSATSRWSPPDGSQAPEFMEIRENLVKDPWALYPVIENGLRQESFELRKQSARRALNDLIQRAEKRLKQAEVSLMEARALPDWKKYGDLLKGALSAPPPLTATNTRQVPDYVSHSVEEIPCDPQLSPQAQVEKFYQLSKRTHRRISEDTQRVEGFSSSIRKWKKQLETLQSLEWGSPEWDSPKWGSMDAWQILEQIERALSDRGTEDKGKTKSKGHRWLGRTFVSRDGLRILVGKSRDENMELTFKIARGNDIWMHVRGKPGAHVVIPIPSGKSAPLETLLDAAILAVHYSGGDHWGTTEVDYTQKKHVKRIKDSTEVTYTHNKTLMIQTNPERLKRLLTSS